MGGSVDRFLEQTGTAPTPQVRPQQPSQTERFLNDSSTQQQLGLAAGVGLTQDPQKAARVLRLQAKTGMPRDLIERNLDAIEAAAASKDFNPATFTRSSPLVAKWLAEDPSHVAVAGQDLEHLNYLERQVKNIAQQFQSGQQTMELNDIGWAAIMGTVTPEQRQRQAEIEREQANQADYGISGFFEGIPGAVANQVPIYANTFFGKVKAAIFGGAAGAATGATVGAVVGAGGGPEGAAIGAQVGAREGAKTGLKLGWKYGSAVAAGRMEASLAYLEFEKIKDANGNPLDRKVMLGAAGVTGVINGVLEMIEFDKVTELAPGLKKFGPQQMRRILETPTGRAAIQRVLKSVGESMVTEGATEFLQDVVKNSLGEIATAISDGSIQSMTPVQLIDKIFSPEHMQEALSDAKAGAQGGGGMSAAFGAAELHSNYQDIKAAQQRQKFFQAVGQTVEQSELTKTMPEKMQEAIAKITKDGPVEHVYAPVETWNEYWQSKSIDPVAAAKEVLGEDISAYTEAQQTGSDIKIPTDRYAVTIAPSEHNKFFADELRLAPDQMNFREAQELKTQMSEADKLAAERDKTLNSGGDAVFEDVQSQLVETGKFDEATAGKYAELYRRLFVSLASRTGLDPLTLYKGYNLSITAPGDAEVDATALNQSAKMSLEDQLFELKKRMAKGEAPTPLRQLAPPTEDAITKQVEATAKAQAVLDKFGLTPKQAAASGLNTDVISMWQAGNARDLAVHYLELAGDNTQRAFDMLYHHFSILQWENPKDPSGEHFDDSFMRRIYGETLGRLRYLYDMEAPSPNADVRDAATRQLGWGAPVPGVFEGYIAADREFEQRAYHGSPHQHEQFSLTKIGSGEGAQSFGWGLYFAGDKQLAMHYRDVLTARRGPQFKVLTDIENAAIPSAIRETIRQRPEFAEQVLKNAQLNHDRYKGMPPASVSVNLGMNLKAHARMIDALSKIVNSERTMFGDYANSKPKGRFFEVEIPDDHNMIHWDEPIYDQPGVVQQFLEDSGFADWIDEHTSMLGKNPVGEDLYTFLQEWVHDGEARDELPPEVFKTVMGYDRNEPPQGWTTDQVVEHELTQFDTRSPEIASRWLNALGVKGIKYLDGQSRAKGHGTYNYVVFDDNAIKIIDYNQRELPPGFTSKAEQLISEKMPKFATVQDVKNILAGAKPDEVKWLGIHDYLDGYLSKSGEKVSKEAVLNTMRASRLNIIETRFGEGGNAMTSEERDEREHELAMSWLNEDAQRAINRAHFKQDVSTGRWMVVLHQRDIGNLYDGDDEVAPVLGPYESKDQAKRDALDDLANELLETHLETYLWRAQDSMAEDMADSDATTYGEYTLPGGEEPAANYREITYSLPDVAPEFTSHAFKKTKGILGWTRVTDRTTVDGKKLLFVEEIQSDWHQWGRERGYASQEATARFEELKQLDRKATTEFNKFVEEMDKKYRGPDFTSWWDEGTPEERKKYKELRQAMMEAAQRVNEYKPPVPDGPFKKTWHEFIMKRLIRMAAEEGYDGIGWTTGDQQNARWGLEKHYSKIVYTPEDLEDVPGNVPGGLLTVQHRTDESYNRSTSYSVREDQLHEYVGHELAKKLLSAPFDGGYMLEGDDLRTGGEGMRGFYDNMLVKFAKDFGKKFMTTPTEERISVSADEIFDRDLESGIYEAETHPQLTEAEKARLDELNQKMEEEISADKDRMTAAEVEERAALMRRRNQAGKAISVRARVHGLPLSPELKQAALNNAFPLFQDEQSDEPLGRIRIKADGSAINIELLQKANLSTFLHETGHFYLEVLDDQGSESTADEQLRADRSTIRSWLGAGETGPFTREQHEQFARAFEQYLMEGKAPTSGLRQAFARFRAWLVALYKRTEELNVPLTDEVRQVFDRLLATDEELAAAADEQHAEPLFADPEQAGMSPEQAAVYSAAIEDARATAEEELTARMMRDVNREKTALWKMEREKMRAQVADEANQDPFWRALALLSRGTLPDGSPLPEHMEAFKLSWTSLRAYFGDDIIKQLPRPYVFTKDGGLHPDIAADILGFKSGADLVGQLVMNGQQSPRQYIESETDRRMKQTQGDLLEDGRTPEEAQKALHNEKRAQLLQKELQHLASNNLPALKGLIRRIAKPLPPLESVRQDAQDTIARKTVRDLRPAQYQRAEARAAREAVEAFTKGDIDLAFQKKQQQLYNHELYVAATKAQDTVDSVLSYMAKFNKKGVREKLAKAGGSYLAQIDAIRSRFDFTKSVTLKELSERESLLAFVQSQHALGYTISVPENLINEAYKQSYKNTSVEELIGIRDAVKQIEHLAKVKNTLLANKRSRDLELAVATMVGEIGVHHDVTAEPLDFNPGFTKRFGDKVRSIVAAHMKPEFIFEWLDGNKEQGPVWSHLFAPLAKAEDDENAMMRTSTTAMRDIFSVYTKNERALWFWKKIKVDGISSELTKSNILAVALNWGNKYNREALMRGYGWDEAQVEKIFAHMDARDWAVVQKIWDHLESYWPQIAQLEKDLNGLAPEKVQADEVVTPYGTFRGGYYPVVFDAKLSWRQAVQDSMKSTQELFGGQWARAMTRHGHTEARTNTGGKPVILDLSALTDHIANVTHDLSHRRAIIDINKMIAHPDLRRAIENGIGKEMYKQLHPWLVNIAGDRRADYVNPIEGILGRARLGATIVNLGWKMTTAVTQFLSYTNTVKEIGPAYSARGLQAVYGKPWKFKSTWNFVTSRSEFMKDRIENYDRDVRDALKRMNVAGTHVGPMSVVGFHTAGVRESFFTFIGLADMGASLPSWMGAYQRAMEGNVEQISKGDEAAAVLYADKVVRTTQGVGNAKDLASAQRGTEIYKAFTMFYSYFSVLFNQFAKTQHQLSIDKNIPRYIASLALLWFIPAAMQSVIVGRGPDPEGEPEDWMKWLFKNELTYPFQSIVLVRDIINGMGAYGYEPSAAFDIFDRMSRTGAAIIDKGVNDKDFTETDVKNAVQAAGYVTKLPTKQLWLTLAYLYDWMTGTESPSNPIEGVYRATVAGPNRRPQ